MAIKNITPCDCDGVCPYGATYNHDCEFYCGVDEPQDNPTIWDDGEDISENSTTEYGKNTTEYCEESKEEKKMTINLTICGATVPVEITEEELNKNGYFKGTPTEKLESAWDEGKRQLADAFFCELVNRMDVTEKQIERLADDKDWDMFRGEITEIDAVDEEEFVKRVLNGDLLREMNAKAEELAPKENYYEFEVELSRTIKQKQTVTITIKAESEDDARSKMYDLDTSTLYDHDAINDYDWETDDWNYDGDTEIDDWYFNGESDEDGENYIEL